MIGRAPYFWSVCFAALTVGVAAFAQDPACTEENGSACLAIGNELEEAGAFEDAGQAYFVGCISNDADACEALGCLTRDGRIEVSQEMDVPRFDRVAQRAVLRCQRPVPPDAQLTGIEAELSEHFGFTEEETHPDVTRCQDEEAAAFSNPHGRVLLLFTIATDGRIINIRTPEIDRGLDRVAACVRAAATGWAFRPIASQYDYSVQLVFSSRELQSDGEMDRVYIIGAEEEMAGRSQTAAHDYLEECNEGDYDGCVELAHLVMFGPPGGSSEELAPEYLEAAQDYTFHWSGEPHPELNGRIEIGQITLVDSAGARVADEVTDALREAFEARQQEMRRCHHLRLLIDPYADGSVDAQFSFRVDGTVGTVSVRRDRPESYGFATCSERVFGSIVLPVDGPVVGQSIIRFWPGEVH